MSRAISRRVFIRTGAMGAAALGLANVTRAAAAPIAVDGSTLSADHLRTLASLVQAVGQAPGTPIKAAAALRGTPGEQYRPWYDQQATVTQASLRALLETVEAGPSNGPFSSMSVSSQLTFLRAWWTGGSAGLRTDQDRRRSDIADAASSMAVSAFESLSATVDQGIEPALVAL